MKIEGKLRKHGFYTTRFVEASNPEEAELKAINLVKNDSHLKDAVQNDKSDSPMIFLEALYELESFEETIMPGSGYTFYIDNEK